MHYSLREDIENFENLKVDAAYYTNYQFSSKLYQLHIILCEKYKFFDLKYVHA